MAQVSLDRVNKSFGAVPVLKDVNITAADGEFLVLVGPSGCGKSTTLRIVAGLETATEGQVFIGGKDVTDLGPGERNCAMVFQNYALYPHMTVAENIGFGMRLRRRSKADIAVASAPVAELLGLGALMDRYPRELSGGQRQRVAIGRALVRNPDVFLFDEPLSNLDAKLRGDMRTEIKALQRRVGKTTLYVTHDQVEAMTMADRIVVMDRGMVVQVGSPLEIYHQPVNQFVAGFFGSPGMNFIRGRSGDGHFVTAGRQGGRVRAPAASGRPAQSGGSLWGSPPHSRLADDGLAMTVRVVEPLGIHTILVCNCEGHEFKLVLPGDAMAAQGSPVRVRFDPQRAHIFPA